MSHISRRLEKVFEAVRQWPADRQDAAAEILEQMGALESEPYELSAEERADLQEALDEVRRGELASDEDVAAVFARLGL
ncbi:hypothetical protein [Reyranella sp. CPCC 100927]|uniref:hypothetical protein n=1 Tax=Reyranella sp. CPCC 100927 TaxID=2599616 RepID=UPI0011B44F77|nr:hypothetical protein [Reyranella sp. CPCC 100927]TWS98518.1 hypothetical protein FQU96_36000 [Reyranella sp. CPCC 100927]